MNVIGEFVTIAEASDPGKRGRSGTVVLETANTLRLADDAAGFTVEKKGTVLLVLHSKKVFSGDDIAGRLEDRLRSKKR